MIPAIGETIRFIPTAYSFMSNGSNEAKERRARDTVTGTVVMIHRRHGWYRVSYPTDYNGIQHECFHFYP